MDSCEFSSFSYESLTSYLLPHLCIDKGANSERHYETRDSKGKNESNENIGKIRHMKYYGMNVFLEKKTTMMSIGGFLFLQNALFFLSREYVWNQEFSDLIIKIQILIRKLYGNLIYIITGIWIFCSPFYRYGVKFINLSFDNSKSFFDIIAI